MRRKGIAAVVATVAVLVVVVVGSGQPATAVPRDVAGTGWHTTPAAIPDQTRSGHLKAESCPTSSFCVAVGDQICPRGIHTGYAEVEPHGKWIVQYIPGLVRSGAFAAPTAGPARRRRRRFRSSSRERSGDDVFGWRVR